MPTRNKITIAIDGYSGTGKSSTAKAVASKLGYIYVDSGAMYRAVTLHFLKNEIDLNDKTQVLNALENIQIDFSYNKDLARYETCLNENNVEESIRGMEVSNYVSAVSAIKAVRDAMIAIQRKLGEAKGVVMDGRDIGTVVFPNADLKFFLTADTKIRAERRQMELKESGNEVSLTDIIKNLEDRDKVDSSREISPLRRAEDAIEIDTTGLSFADQVGLIIDKANETINV
ncbi:MAG: (d)CMP kinase [Bacteroidetes bacterium]|nr:(d)CMP kinase [Bacteroidota bacterium]